MSLALHTSSPVPFLSNPRIRRDSAWPATPRHPLTLPIQAFLAILFRDVSVPVSRQLWVSKDCGHDGPQLGDALMVDCISGTSTVASHTHILHYNTKAATLDVLLWEEASFTSVRLPPG